MSKVLSKSTPHTNGKDVITCTTSATLSDYDDLTSTSSILEFLSKEQECCSDADADSIFKEVSRLAGESTRSVDELIREAESLLRMNGGDDGKGRCGAANKQTVTKQAKQTIKLNAKYTKRIENVRPLVNENYFAAAAEAGRQLSTSLTKVTSTPTPQTPNTPYKETASPFAAFVDNLPTESVISEESTPKDMQNMTLTAHEDDPTTIEAQLNNDDDTDEGTDTMEEITECMETIELSVEEEQQNSNDSHNATSNVDSNEVVSISSRKTAASPTTLQTTHSTRKQHTKSDTMSTSMTALVGASTSMSLYGRRPSCDTVTFQQTFYTTQIMPSPSLRNITPLNFNPTQACSPTTPYERRNSIGARRASMTNTPDSGHYSQTTATPRPNSPPLPTLVNTVQRMPCQNRSTSCDKSVNSSPKHFTSTLTSPIQQIAGITREHALKQEIELLQEKLKDTEERLQSLRIQHDSLSQLHRDLRESNTRLQEESEMLKLDVQHLNECANILRTELQGARNERREALELQKVLQSELEETRQEKKRTQEQKDADSKTIQDLQRQCREMERILMRKHPDSVSALIVASKNPGNRDQDSFNSRKLLEQRIAQLESDAKEQDKKAQQILANVQARFNSVQAKYETHIADLETQVLSLQEINTKLNEKIESQVRTLDYFVTKRTENYYNNSTQTDETVVHSTTDQTLNTIRVLSPLPATSTSGTQTIRATRDHSTNTIGGATGGSQPQSAGSSASSTTNSTPNNSRPNSKQSGIRKPMSSSMSLTSALASKLPVSQSDSTISLSAHHAAAREDAHLLATIRGMRVDLAVKDKAIQRLTRELDECKKTIRKLQREKEAIKTCNSSHGSGPSSSTSTLRRNQDYHAPANTETQAIREAHSKLKLMEADYKSLHDKRLQDLKALQTAHERELATCHETVRILQQRLNERDEANGMPKRRKLPVDYYALKAKVSSLERRHTEREERLHMLVEALSKGRLNGALEDLLRDNNNK